MRGDDRLVMRGENHAHTWQVTDGLESVTLGVERHLGWIRHGTIWIRETETATRRTPGTPKAFHGATRFWRRFLEHHGIHDFQLRLEQRTIHLLGPPPRRHHPAPEWTISIALPSRQFRTLTMSHSFWSRKPPTSGQAARYAELMALPVLKPELHFKEAILFEGDLLLQFLENTLEHTLETMTAKGRWQGTTRAETEDTARDHRIKAGLLPETRYFIPNKSRAPQPDGLLRAVAYDVDRQLLICGRRSHYRALQLSRPLHRLVEAMTFGGPLSDTVLKGVRFRVPRGYLFLDRSAPVKRTTSV